MTPWLLLSSSELSQPVFEEPPGKRAKSVSSQPPPRIDQDQSSASDRDSFIEIQPGEYSPSFASDKEAIQGAGLEEAPGISQAFNSSLQLPRNLKYCLD